MTEQVQERLCAALAGGNHFDTACSYAGISYSTFRSWIVSAQKPDPDPKLLKFLEAITRAIHDSEMYAVDHIKRQIPQDCRAGIAFLERRFPQKWGRRERVEVTGAGGGPVSIMAEARQVLGDPETREVLDEAAELTPLLEAGGGEE